MQHTLRRFRARAAAGLAAAAFALPAAASTTIDDTLATLHAAFDRAVAPGEQADLYRGLFASLLQRVQRSYAGEVEVDRLAAAALRVMEPMAPGAGEPAQVFGKAMNAALATLDPYSRYLDARAWTTQRSERNGSFGGIGLQVEAGDGAVRVVMPMPGSPAARAGVQAGDVIVRVDDQPLVGVALADAIARMRGTPGTAVALTLRRPGVAEDITLSLTRDTIREQPLRWRMEGEVLVVRIASFSGPVTTELRQAISEATAAQPARGLVLDLRGNPGGLLREAVTMADTFLAQGEIVSLRNRGGTQRSWQADADELLPGVPMVVLLDRGSASASELVAVALQENGRATVMGQRSFGKGTVQSTMSLGSEGAGALKLTTSFYHGPNGRPVNKAGVLPDVELGTVPPPLQSDAVPPPLAAAGESPLPAPVAAAPRARIEPGRCSAVYKAPDPALACAVGLLLAGELQAFLSQVAAASP